MSVDRYDGPILDGTFDFANVNQWPVEHLQIRADDHEDAMQNGNLDEADMWLIAREYKHIRFEIGRRAVERSVEA